MILISQTRLGLYTFESRLVGISSGIRALRTQCSGFWMIIMRSTSENTVPFARSCDLMTQPRYFTQVLPFCSIAVLVLKGAQQPVPMRAALLKTVMKHQRGWITSSGTIDCRSIRSSSPLSSGNFSFRFRVTHPVLQGCIESLFP